MLTRKVEFSSCIISIEYIYTNVDKIKRGLAHVEKLLHFSKHIVCSKITFYSKNGKISAKFDTSQKSTFFDIFLLVCGKSLSEP